MNISRASRLFLFGATLLGSILFAADGELAALTAKAERGNAIAQYNLGLAYAEGRGVAVDHVEAYVWLSLALENGARGRALDALTARLTAAELDQARTRLAARRTTLGLREPAAATATTAQTAPGATAPAGGNTELDQARTDRQQLSAELAAAWKEADQLKAEVERLRAAADDAEQLRRERDALSAKLTELAGDLASLRAERDQLGALAAQAQKESADARDMKQAFQEQARASEMRVGELVRQAEQLKAELGRANESIAALQAPRPAAENPELAQRTRELAAATAELQDLQKTVTDLRASLRRASDDHQSLQRMAGQAQETALALGKELDGARARIAELEQRPAAPAHPDLRDRVAALQRDLEAARNAAPAYPDLRNRVAALETELGAAHQSAAALDTRLAALATAKDGVETELQTVRAQLSRSREQAASTLEDTEKLRATARQLETALAEAKQAQPAAPAYPDLRERVTELEAQVAALREAPPTFPDLRQRVAELEAAAAQLAARAAGADKTREELAEQTSLRSAAERSLASAQAELSMLESDKSSLRRQVDANTAETTHLRGQVAALQQQLAATANRPDTPAYPDLRERVTELEAQVAALRDAPPAFPDLRGRVAELEQQIARSTDARPAYPDLRVRVEELSGELADARRAAEHAAAEHAAQGRHLARLEDDLADAKRVASRPATPGYPDLRERVAELEQQAAAAQSRPSAPAYPDLSGRVQQLENELAAARAELARATPAAPAPANSEDLAARLAETEGKLATALRGYSLLQKEHDELQARTAQSGSAANSERDSLAARLATAEEAARSAQAEIARLGDSLAALQRSSGQSGTELAQARALIQQLQGTNMMLAQQNYQLRAALATDPGAARASPAAPAARTHVVAAGESLSRISQRYYGTPARWQDIFNANRDVVDPSGAIRVGMTLRIP